MTRFARPPRGWFYGVLLTIFVFWYSGVLWEAFQEGERRGKLVGGAVMLVAGALTAYDALTNDGYRTSRLSRVTKVMFLLGLIVYLVLGHI